MKVKSLFESYNQRWTQAEAVRYVIDMIGDAELDGLEPGQLQLHSWHPVIQLPDNYTAVLKRPAVRRGLTNAINSALNYMDYCDSEEDCVDARDDAITEFLLKSKIATKVADPD